MAYEFKNMQTSDLLNLYLTVNINNICRICLEKSTKLMPIFDPIKPPHFSVLVMACASVQVNEGDGLPPYICQKCVGKLNVAYQFKTQCENADAKLRQCLETLQQMPEPPDVTNYEEIKKDSNQQITYATSVHTHITHEGRIELNTQEVSNLQMHNDKYLPDDTEMQEPQLENLQNVSLDSDSTLQVIDKNTLSELKLEFSDLKGDIIDLKVEDINPVITTNNTNQTKPKRPIKDHQCDTCGKIFRTKPGLVHHIRIHTGERPYVCHLCDKRFINGGHLHTHMRTHTGEKNHVCSACSKAFATAQQLTKHTIAIHTSERPYGCTYCPKRFASSSNLSTHIKIHTGEKNYHCDQCGKAFSTKGQLYQHMLVHTGEKAFLCEFCNKRFSQKAHLVRHLKMHKN